MSEPLVRVTVALLSPSGRVITSARRDVAVSEVISRPLGRIEDQLNVQLFNQAMDKAKRLGGAA